MQLKRAPLRLAHPDDDAFEADVDRTAAVLTLAGCALAMVAAILPWVEQVTLGFALTAQGRHAPSILLAVVAAVSAGIAGTVLLRRKPAAGVAILLIGLAVAQLGAAIWFDVTTVNEIRETHPHLVLMSTIGTGVYPAGLGAVSTLAGAILAWTRRRIQ